MPEIPEVHRFSQMINQWANGKVFSQIIDLKHALNLPVSMKEFTMVSQTKGKEQTLTLQDVHNNSKIVLRFNHGLLGHWIIQGPAQFEKLRFVTREGAVLSYVDPPNMARVSIGGGFDPKRGPDPIDQPAEFEQNLSRFKKPKVIIGEAMLDQEYFNGIGNYLRSEILHRAGIDPRTEAIQLLADPVQRKLIASLCHSVSLEVLSQPMLNKYGTPAERDAFENWLQCYQKAPVIVDSKKRKMFSFFFKSKFTPTSKPSSSLPSKVAKPQSLSQPSGPPSVATLSASGFPHPQPKNFYSNYPPLFDLDSATGVSPVIEQTTNLVFHHIATRPSHVDVSADEHRYMSKGASSIISPVNSTTVPMTLFSTPAPPSLPFPSPLPSLPLLSALASPPPPVPTLSSNPNLSRKTVLLMLIHQTARLSLITPIQRSQLKDFVLQMSEGVHRTENDRFLHGVYEAYAAEPEFTDWRDIAESFLLILGH